MKQKKIVLKAKKVEINEKHRRLLRKLENMGFQIVVIIEK